MSHKPTRKEKEWIAKHKENEAFVLASNHMDYALFILELRKEPPHLKLDGENIDVPFLIRLDCQNCGKKLGSLAIIIRHPDERGEQLGSVFKKKIQLLKHHGYYVAEILADVICPESVWELVSGVAEKIDCE